MKDEQLARTMREIIDMASRTMFKETECTNEAINLAKAYADARESKEIAELKAESKYWNERWEAGNKFQDAAFNSEIENYHEVKRLNAEIKRFTAALHTANVGAITMGEAIERAAFDRGVHYARVTKWTPETTEKNDSFLGLINDARKKFRESMELVLSPAPVMEGKEIKTYKCNKCGVVVKADDTPLVCVLHVTYRTSGVCGGAFNEITQNEDQE